MACCCPNTQVEQEPDDWIEAAGRAATAAIASAASSCAIDPSELPIAAVALSGKYFRLNLTQSIRTFSVKLSIGILPTHRASKQHPCFYTHVALKH